jgi:putative DNA primase/helicase
VDDATSAEGYGSLSEVEIVRREAAKVEPRVPTGVEVEPFGDKRDDEVIRYVTTLEAIHDGSRSQSAGTSSTDPVRFTDVGNSTRFVDEHRGKIRYIGQWRSWLVWRGHCWIVDPDSVVVTELAKDVSRRLYLEAAASSAADARRISKWATQSARRGSIGAMIELARGIEGIPIDVEDLDADAWILGVPNGTVELRTGVHRPGLPADLVTRQTGAPYAPDAECPTWDRCLEEWFPNAETRSYVQRLAGSTLVGRQRDHVFVIHYGTGRNGKGTFIRGLAGTLGDYFAVPHKSLIVHERSERHDTERAALFRVRLAVAGETSRRQSLDEAQIKNLTGADRISARRLYENPWQFDPSHSLWLQTNYLPNIVGTDPGIWERMKVVPWVVMFDDAQRDETLDEKLEVERPGILRWLIDGCLAWQRDGLDEPPEVLTATAHYRAAEDVLGRFGDATSIQFEDGLDITAKRIREALTRWCEDEGIKRPPPWKDVADWLKKNGASNAGQAQRRGVRASWWDHVGFPTIESHETGEWTDRD